MFSIYLLILFILLINVFRDEDELEDQIAALREQAMLQLKRAVGKDAKEQREKV